MATLESGGFYPDNTKKVNLGTGIVGEAIMSPTKTTTQAVTPNQLFARLASKPRVGGATRLPSLPPKRQSQSPSHLSLYKTQSTNPYKAVVATNRQDNKDVVPASKYIGIHHCSIEFNAAALKPAMQVTGGLKIEASQKRLLSQSLNMASSSNKDGGKQHNRVSQN